MKSKTVLVSGAGSGLGRAMAEDLAGRGHRVYAGLRTPSASAPVGTLPVALDVTSDESVDAAVATILAAEGRLDVVINNAGLMAAGIVEGYSPAAMQRVFDVNVFGVQRLCRATLPVLRRQRSGLLVFISSRSGRLAIPFTGIYCASKHALEAMAEAYRYELSPSGVDSVLVEPGAFPTQLGANMVRADDPERVDEYGDIGRIPAAMGKRLAEAHAQPDAPTPMQFASAVSALIEMPAGQRPLRTVVDPQAQAAVEQVNASYAAVMHRLLHSMGFQHLLQPAPPPPET